MMRMSELYTRAHSVRASLSLVAQLDELGGGKRAAVTVTIGANTVRLRLGVMGGQNLKQTTRG
jgi:hypothetical protein